MYKRDGKSKEISSTSTVLLVKHVLSYHRSRCFGSASLRCRSSCDGHDRHRRIVQHWFPPVLQVCPGPQVVRRPAGPWSLEHSHRRRYCRSWPHLRPHHRHWSWNHPVCQPARLLREEQLQRSRCSRLHSHQCWTLSRSASWFLGFGKSLVDLNISLLP